MNPSTPGGLRSVVQIETSEKIPAALALGPDEPVAASQEPVELRHGERGQAISRRVEQPFLDQPRSRRAELLGGSPDQIGDVAGALGLRAQLGHRPHVAELELARPLHPHAEEAPVELGFDDGLGLDGLEGRDRRRRRVVPQDLSVLLEEVGVPLRIDDDGLDRSIVDLDSDSESRPMTGNLKRRSAYDFASPASRGRCGSPAPTRVIGSRR